MERSSSNAKKEKLLPSWTRKEGKYRSETRESALRIDSIFVGDNVSFEIADPCDYSNVNL